MINITSMSSQRPVRRSLGEGGMLGSYLRIEDSSLRWSDRKGFTLIELSIVLVIIGLIVGGVLVGQDLIKAAELRKISSQITSFQTAIHTFRLKYNGLPGDINNATSFFSGTANGNRDRKIHYTNESARAWQQLGLAGLVDGTYSGTGAPSSPGVNLPSGPKSGTGFALYWTDQYGNLTNDTKNPHRFVFGTPGGGTMAGAALMPVDLLNMDTKLDDGAPLTGNFTAWHGAGISAGSCHDSATQYNADNEDNDCYFIYAID